MSLSEGCHGLVCRLVRVIATPEDEEFMGALELDAITGIQTSNSSKSDVDDRYNN